MGQNNCSYTMGDVVNGVEITCDLSDDCVETGEVMTYNIHFHNQSSVEKNALIHAQINGSDIDGGHTNVVLDPGEQITRTFDAVFNEEGTFHAGLKIHSVTEHCPIENCDRDSQILGTHPDRTPISRTARGVGTQDHADIHCQEFQVGNCDGGGGGGGGIGIDPGAIISFLIGSPITVGVASFAVVFLILTFI